MSLGVIVPQINYSGIGVYKSKLNPFKNAVIIFLQTGNFKESLRKKKIIINDYFQSSLGS